MPGVSLKFPGIADMIDIFIVAAVLYWVMVLLKRTRAEKMLWALGFIVVVYFVSERAGLTTLHWLLRNFLGSIVILIIVVFQQDIRRALVRMGRHITERDTGASMMFVDELIPAVKAMSEERIGGLIALERGVNLTDLIEAGESMDAPVSKELLLTIFNPSGMLHDGAVVVSRGRIATAGSILPLTDSDVSAALGTRHRAAIGLSEETDAVIIVVSEETGEVSLVADGEIEKNADLSTLAERLKGMLVETGGAAVNEAHSAVKR